MKNTPINYEIVNKCIRNSGIKSIGSAAIREIRKLINDIEIETDEKFIRLEMGIPGLPTPEIGIEAEKNALDSGVTNQYPNIDGLPELKHEIARFSKLFLDLSIDDFQCIPTIGSMNGAFGAFMVAGRMNKSKDTVLFIDPGFPVHKQLVKMLGLKQEQFDIYNFRGEKLHEKLESILKKGNISSILYSNPNNPSWICLSEDELKIIGTLANKYQVVVIEDLAYFAMDFRSDLSKPGLAPFQPTVAKYTDHYILLISSSKIFSYAGQRIAMMVISEKLFNFKSENLKDFYSSDHFGHCVIIGTIYGTSGGPAHTAQYGLTAMLKAVNEGRYDFIGETKVYGKKALEIKNMFVGNGFHIVYDWDTDSPIADGFYFTIAFPNFSGEQLCEELFYYGISTLPLSSTGSEKTEGVRICVSLVKETDFPLLKSRLEIFKLNHTSI